MPWVQNESVCIWAGARCYVSVRTPVCPREAVGSRADTVRFPSRDPSTALGMTISLFSAHPPLYLRCPWSLLAHSALLPSPFALLLRFAPMKACGFLARRHSNNSKKNINSSQRRSGSNICKKQACVSIPAAVVRLSPGLGS